MDKREIKSQLRDFRLELEQELQRLEQSELKVARLRRTIASMEALIDEPSASTGLSLKDEIRTALRAAGAGKEVTVPEVRAILKELNYRTIEGHNNPAASTLNILQRLVDDGEVAYGPERDGKRTYVWRLRSYGAASSLANRIADRDRDLKRKKK